MGEPTKLVTREHLLSFRESCREGEKRVVWVNGCFDLCHAGHVQNLRFAKSLGDYLFVGLNSDRSIRGLKGPGRPILDQSERAALLSAISYVDMIILFHGASPDSIIRALKPDAVCKGEEYRDKLPIQKFVERYGGKVHFSPMRSNISSTDIIERVRRAYS